MSDKDNFQRHYEIQLLADTHSKYQLAKMVIESQEKLEEASQRKPANPLWDGPKISMQPRDE